MRSLTLCVLSAALATASAATSTPLMLPDLNPVADAAQDLMYGWTLDQNIMPGSTLLRLSTSIANIGDGPMEIRGLDPNADGSQPVVQRIYTADGSEYEDRLAGTFFYHPEHGHIHFNDFVTYRLRLVNPDGSKGAIVRNGAKTSFCLADWYEFDPLMPNFNPEGPYGDCSQVQGISVGWGDVYVQSLPDQWIDVTGLSDGQYFLEVVADEANLIVEKDETNNDVAILIDLRVPRTDVSGYVFNDVSGNGDQREGKEGDLAGVKVYVDDNHNKQFDSGSLRVASTNASTIYDGLSAYVDLDVHGTIGLVDGVEVEMNVTHNRPSDLDIFLLSPSGRRVQLINRKGTGNNIIATFADDGSVTTGQVRGRVKPTQPLAGFAGTYGDGHWRLEVADRRTGQAGVLNSWAVKIAYSEKNTVSDTRGKYVLADVPAIHTGLGVVLPGATWRQTFPAANDIHHMDPTDGRTIMCKNFGLTQSAEVSGVVANDLNCNGRRNAEDGALAGWTVYRDINKNGVFDHGPVTMKSQDTPVKIPDTEQGVSYIDTSDLSGTISSVSVLLNIKHTYTPDLTITLISPSGTESILFSRLGTEGENFENTVIVDRNDHSAAMHPIPITGGFAPYTGIYASQEPLRSMWGEPVNGIWTLICKDNEEEDKGKIKNWSLIVNFAEPNVVTGEGGQWKFTDVPDGRSFFAAEPKNGWCFTTRNPLKLSPGLGQVLSGNMIGVSR